MAVNGAGLPLAIENGEQPPRMEESFRQLLKANRIPDQLITVMETENMLNPADMAYYVGDKEGILTFLLNMTDETRGKRKYLLFFSKIFDEAQASSKESAER